MRILVVDDSMIMRRVVVDTLRAFERSAEVVEAGTAEEALAVLTGSGGSEVGLVLLDWYLPGMSGLDLLDALQADPRLSRVPVVMVTSERAKPNVIEAMRRGARNYIVKPFTQEVFRKKITPLLSRDSARGPEPEASGLVGNLAHTLPLEVVQLISMTKKTGVLRFDGQGRHFDIHFKDGQIEHAEGDGLEGEEAFLAASGLSEGSFTFTSAPSEHPVTLRRSTDMILLDAFNRATEGRQTG